jgi:hypothetical protein
MRRICFDIASNYFHHGTDGFLNEPSDAREYFRDRTFRFDAATVLDSSNRTAIDFTNSFELLECLVSGDEIISFNGRTSDLIVLEKLVGEGPMRMLWLKPHHDLRGWRNYFKLETACSGLMPGIAASFNKIESERLAKIRKSYSSDFIASRLANTYRDAKVTLELFDLYLMSGDSSHTFRDG